jgi:hypothetical protein
MVGFSFKSVVAASERFTQSSYSALHLHFDIYTHRIPYGQEISCI